MAHLSRTFYIEPTAQEIADLISNWNVMQAAQLISHLASLLNTKNVEAYQVYLEMISKSVLLTDEGAQFMVELGKYGKRALKLNTGN